MGMTVAVAIAAAVMTISTRWGLAMSSDSARYVRTARHVLGTEPIVETDMESKGGQGHYPPFYPISLAAAARVTGLDPVPAARWLHVVMFALGTALVGLLVRHFGAAGPGILAAMAFALSPVMITTHAWLLSEALFTVLALLTMWLLVLHIEVNRTSLLLAAAVTTSLGMLTRYAGAAMGPACVAALLLFANDTSWRARIRKAIVFSGIALVLPLGLLVRNAAAGGSAVNRTLSYHPVSIDHIKDGIAAVATWTTPLGIASARDAANARPVVAIMGLLVFVAVIATGIVLAWRERLAPLGRLAGMLVLFMLSFVTLLVFSISLVDFHTPLDTRVLSPVFAGWVVLGGCVLSWFVVDRGRPSRAIAFAVAVVLIGVLAWPSFTLVSRLWSVGDGFTHPQWRDSATMAAVRQLPPGIQVFTNAPGAVYLLSGRQFIWTIPPQIIASSRLPNPDHDALMARISEELHAGRGVVVWLNRYGARRPGYPTAEQIRRRLGLQRSARFSDGAIYEHPASTRSAH